MRRNLTLEETGVLDLRKFQAPNEQTFSIPFDWLLLQGITPNDLNNLGLIANFLKSKFNLFIIAGGIDFNTPDYASTSLNRGEDSNEVAGLISGDYIYVDEIPLGENIVLLTI